MHIKEAGFLRMTSEIWLQHIFANNICSSSHQTFVMRLTGIRLFTGPCCSERSRSSSSSSAHRHWQPFCNLLQMQLGGGRRSVKIAACSSYSRRTYGKIGDCEWLTDIFSPLQARFRYTCSLLQSAFLVVNHMMSSLLLSSQLIARLKSYL